jgi:hypothetical protein
MNLYIAIGKEFAPLDCSQWTGYPPCPTKKEVKFLQKGLCRSICTYYNFHGQNGLCVIGSPCDFSGCCWITVRYCMDQYGNIVNDPYTPANPGIVCSASYYCLPIISPFGETLYLHDAFCLPICSAFSNQ